MDLVVLDQIVYKTYTMPSIAPSHQGPKDRRMACRFPIDASVSFVLLKGNTAVAAGKGITIDLSSDGVLFRPVRPVPSGMNIELSIAWPTRIDRGVDIQLWIFGRTVRQQDACTAIRILQSEFRTTRTRKRSLRRNAIAMSA
jgi:hypothetical protein